jgi:hypothetical protein
LLGINSNEDISSLSRSPQAQAREDNRARACTIDFAVAAVRKRWNGREPAILVESQSEQV